MAQIAAQKCEFSCDEVAVLYCKGCDQFLCVECRQNLHDRVRKFKEHEVVDIHKEGNRVRPNPVCETHGNQFLYYCSKCECLTCAECMTSSHNEHKTEKIKTVADARRQNVDKIIEQLKTKVETAKQKLETIDTKHSIQIKSDCESYVKTVEETVDDLHKIVDRHKLIPLTTASDFKDIENEDLGRKRAFFENRHDETVDRLLKFENLLQETHDSTFLTEWKALQTDVKMNDEETDDPLVAPRRIESFNQQTFTRSVIDEIDEKFQMRLKEQEQTVVRLTEGLDALNDELVEKQEHISKLQKNTKKLESLEEEKTKLKDEMKLKLDEIGKLSNEVHTNTDIIKKLTIKFEDRIRELESKLAETEKENKSKLQTGSFALPKELCAQEYYGGMQDSFTKFFEDNLSSGRKDYQRSLSGSGLTYQTGYNDDSKAPSNGNDRHGADGPTKQQKVTRHDRILTNQFVFSLDNKVNVKLVKGNITDSKTSVIVCPQDEYLSGCGRIAKAIHNKASEVYDDVNAMNLKTINLKTADVYPLKARAAVIWKYIFHVVAPRWGLMSTKDNTGFERKLEKTVLNILQRAEEYTAIESVAIPLLGVSLDETNYPTPVQACCRCIVNGIMMYVSKGKKLDIELWGFDDAVVSTLREALSQILNPTKTSDPQTNFSKSMHHWGTTSSTPTSYKGALTSHKEASIKDDLYVSKKGSNDEFGKTMKVDTIKDQSCSICMDNLTNPKKLTCGHIFCKECIDTALKQKPACPSCNFVFGKLTGNQPKGGTMHRYVDKWKDLPGYRGLGHIKINYYIPSGIQGDEHPNPGKPYDTISRPAYLPNNEKGRLVADLLETAFDQRLIFTIGQSRTSGEEGVVTWNDIHHKTRMEGGPQRFGYPDDTYLDRVMDELAAKGVTKDSLKS